jgi:hypothetical protein
VIFCKSFRLSRTTWKSHMVNTWRQDNDNYFMWKHILKPWTERYTACCKYLDDLSVSNVLEVVESMLSASFSIGKNVVEEEVRLDVLQSLLSLWIQELKSWKLNSTSQWILKRNKQFGLKTFINWKLIGWNVIRWQYANLAQANFAIGYVPINL